MAAYILVDNRYLKNRLNLSSVVEIAQCAIKQLYCIFFLGE